jgi:hypothetical protein
MTWEDSGMLRSVGINHRGGFLVIFGLVYVSIGASLLWGTAGPRTVAVLHPLTALTHAPVHYWGLVWLICGLFALVNGMPKLRRHQPAGCAALMFPPAMWGTLFVIALLGGDEFAALGVCTYALFIGAIANEVVHRDVGGG